VTGAIAAALTGQDWLNITVEMVNTGPDHTGQILVTGNNSGTRLAINVEVLTDE
jgi:hypothetical protein